MFSFKRANKNFQKRVRRASDFFYDIVGLSPRKELLRAILAGDEEKAIEVYVLDSNGKSLEQDMYPSLPILENNHHTPMHLAAMKGMEKLLQMFMAHGGNPNVLNGNNETCLHAVCHEPCNDTRKRDIVVILLHWEQNCSGHEGSLNETGMERVSVNMVDSDGNTACHYAASAGLTECVSELVSRGAIISIVNKDQMTCCELADFGLHAELANSLELALVFPPADQSSFVLLEGREFSHEADCPIYLPNSSSYTMEAIFLWRRQQIQLTKEAIGSIPNPQLEALLDKYEWNVNELVNGYTSGSAEAMAKNSTEDLHGAKYENIIDEIKMEFVSCSICAEPLSPPLSSQELTLMSDSSENIGNERDTVEISCGGGHSFCFACWSTHLRMRVVENSLTSLSCPAYQCGEALNATEWAECLLGSDIAARFRANLCRHVVESCAQFLWCPAKDCDLAIRIEDNFLKSTPTTPCPQTVTCGNGHSVCVACKESGHAPCTCEQYNMWRNKIAKEIKNAAALDTNDVATALWVQANTKKCPKCKTPIEKDEGCNHMTCKKCRYDFCWICMQRWENHSNRTGGYFQCNMFMIGNDSESDSSKKDLTLDAQESTLFSENYSGGSSTKESTRLRKNAAIMDRFIQHYSGFKAHEESVQLEVKMFFDTLDRITSSLRRSFGDDLCWLRGDVQHPLISVRADQTVSDSSAYADLSRRGDVEAVNSVAYPILFLQKGFRELIKCRQLLKSFFPFSFYMLSDDNSYHGSFKNSSNRVLVESRKDVIDQAKADLETLTETLSNIVARKRLRASRYEIERATRAARSQRLEFENILSEFQKASFSNANIKSRSKSKKKHHESGQKKFGLKSSREFESMESNGMNQLSIFDNIEFINALSPSFNGSSFEDGEENAIDLNFLSNNYISGRASSPSFLRNQEVIHGEHSRDSSLQSQSLFSVRDLDAVDLPYSPSVNNLSLDDSELRVSTAQANRSRSSSSSSSSSLSSLNIRQVGRDGQSFAVQSKSSNLDTSERHQSKPSIFSFAEYHENEEPDIAMLDPNSEELEMNKAILLSLQEPQNRNAHKSDNVPEPSESDIQSLVVMGFEREPSTVALRDCSNSVEDAIMLLLSKA